MVKHLACIMDGNRRWAQERFLLPWQGHERGAQTIKSVMQFCREHTIPYLSLYTFSLENLKRDEQEKSFIFNYFIQDLEQIIVHSIEHGIRIRFIGDRAFFPTSVVPACEEIESKTAHLKTLQVQFLFCYGSRQEIVEGVKSLARRVQAGVLDPEEITADLLINSFWSADIPEPDLIIRTGGCKRLSNFLLYQSAYSELYFLDCLWPDLSETHLKQAITYFQTCKRNFGV
jgi:undecaprenyl diphosphate synthase